MFRRVQVKDEDSGSEGGSLRLRPGRAMSEMASSISVAARARLAPPVRQRLRVESDSSGSEGTLSPDPLVIPRSKPIPQPSSQTVSPDPNRSTPLSASPGQGQEEVKEVETGAERPLFVEAQRPYESNEGQDGFLDPPEGAITPPVTPAITPPVTPPPPPPAEDTAIPAAPDWQEVQITGDYLVTPFELVRIRDGQENRTGISGGQLQFGGKGLQATPVAHLAAKYPGSFPSTIETEEVLGLSETLLLDLSATDGESALQLPPRDLSLLFGDPAVTGAPAVSMGVGSDGSLQVLLYNEVDGDWKRVWRSGTTPIDDDAGYFYDSDT